MGGWSLGLLLGSIGCVCSTIVWWTFGPGFLWEFIWIATGFLIFILGTAISISIMSIWRLTKRDPEDNPMALTWSAILSGSIAFLFSIFGLVGALEFLDKPDLQSTPVPPATVVPGATKAAT